LRRLALFAALAFAAACSNSDPIKAPQVPPVASTTTIQFSTYLGKDLADVAQDVALDAAGNSYVVGGALSPDLLPGAPVRAYAASEDAFVAKFDANGQVLWWTFLGGPGPDRGYAIEIDPAGDVVIGGSAADGFPVTPGAVLTQFQGGAGACTPGQPATECTPSTTVPARDGFVAKLSGASGTLLWATYFGSGTFEADVDVEPCTGGPDGVSDFNDDLDPVTSVVRDVAVDPLTGEIYLTFSVKSSLQYFPDPDVVTNPTNCTITSDGPIEPAVVRNLPPVILSALNNGAPALDTLGGSGVDGILAKLSPTGSSLAWATYVGGRGNESDAIFVRVDSQGNPVVLLATDSDIPAGNRVTSEDPLTKAVVTTEPIVESAFGLTFNGGSDFYLAKYDLGGTLIWATYLGGSATELVESANLALRPDDTVVVAAGTNSANFATPGTWDPTYNGTGGSGFYAADCGLAVIAPDASALLAATYYGGASGDGCSGVAVDSRSRIYVTGGSSSPDLPLRAGPHQTQLPGVRSAFLAIFSADLSTLYYSGYFGGTGSGNSNALVVRSDTASSGHVTFAGQSEASYPLTPAPGTPARATVTAPPAHGVLTDATLGF
jgi:hypothetical protein